MRMILIVILCIMPSAVLADEFCAGVRTALKVAGEQFRPLRGQFDFILQEYKSKVTFGYLDDCSVTGDAKVASVECSLDSHSEIDANRAWNRAISELKRCLGKDLDAGSLVARSGGKSINYTYLPTEDDINVSDLYLPKHDIYSVSVEIVYVDESK